jgi:hypothetical protein
MNNYETMLEQMFCAEEKNIYKRILKELEENKEFYENAEPEEKTKALVCSCGITEKELYRIMKKIANCHRDYDANK